MISHDRFQAQLRELLLYRVCCCTRLCVFYGRDVRSMDNKTRRSQANKHAGDTMYAIKTFLIIVSSKVYVLLCMYYQQIVPVTCCRASDRLYGHHSSVRAPRFPDNTQHGSRCPQRRKLHTCYMLSLDIFSLAFRFLSWWHFAGLEYKYGIMARITTCT